jgi:hypothetical protein
MKSISKRYESSESEGVKSATIESVMSKGIEKWRKPKTMKTAKGGNIVMAKERRLKIKIMAAASAGINGGISVKASENIKRKRNGMSKNKVASKRNNKMKMAAC